MSRERERLPRRGAGYTSSSHLSISGTGTEVDSDVLDEFARAAAAKSEQRKAAAAAYAVRAIQHIGSEVEMLMRVLDGGKVSTPPIRNRLRRISHDLASLADELQ